MSALWGALGLGILLLFAGLTMIFSLSRWNKKVPFLRKIRAVEKLEQSISMTVEAGTRIHISIGNAELLSASNGSALSGLSSLEKIISVSSLGDRKPLTTSGESNFAILAESVSRGVSHQEKLIGKTEPATGTLSGVTPLSYAAGALQVIRKEQVSTNLFIGNFGPEIALLAEASAQEFSSTLGASNSLTAQSILFVCADEPIIGEELFALPAYLKRTPSQYASVRVQDVFRWIFIGSMVIGAVLAFFGFL
jgi:hypothetical protein